MNEKTIIVTYGLPGAGKSTILSIADELDIPSIVMGDLVRERAREEISEPLTSELLGQWATKQREKHGKTVMAEYTCNAVQEMDASMIVVDGSRSASELHIFESEFNVITFRIDSRFTDRLHRLQNRDRDGEGNFTPYDLQERDVRELNWGLGNLFAIDSPNYHVENSESLTTFKEETRTAFHDLLNRNNV